MPPPGRACCEFLPREVQMEHLEGRQAVLAALQARQRRINVILLRHGLHTDDLAELLALAEANNVPIRHVDPRELDQLAHGATHGGVLAVATAKPRMPVDNLLGEIRSATNPPFLLLLEGVDDARNLGFVIRTAEACGAMAVLIKKHLWDFDPVEISRPSSGAYERLPLVQISDTSELLAVKKAGVRLVGCLAGAKRPIWEHDLRQPTLLAIGGEKRGLSGAVRGICDRFVTIPTVGGPTSLSLSHAAGIVLAETLRQRRASAAPALTGGPAALDSIEVEPVPDTEDSA